MKDLPERLRFAANELTKGGGFWRDGDIELLQQAANEIERLQKFAGAVTSGHSVSEIKELLRTPEGIAKLRENYEALPK